MTENLLKLVIGAELELDSLADVVLNNLHSELLGYNHNQNLLISHPKKDGIPVQIDPGEKFIVSIKQDGEDVCFETEVVALMMEPYPHLHTTYPVSIRSGSIRKSNRVPAAPARIRLISDEADDETILSIMNVSCAGACLLADRRLGAVDDMFQIDLQKEDGKSEAALTCMIRYVHETHKDQQPMFSHGVVFIGMDAEEQLFIWKYFQESAALLS